MKTNVSPSYLEKLKVSVSILRPVNCIFGGLTVLIGVLACKVLIATPSNLPWILLLGWTSYFFIAGAGNIINDIFDLEIDKVNRPDRPLPSGRLSLKEARLLFILTCGIGNGLSLVAGILFSPLSGFVALFTLSFSYIGYWYAKVGKVTGFPGNLVVGVSFSFGILFGAWLCVTIPPIHTLLFFGTSFSLLVAREIIKGAEDIRGDSLRDVKTLARKKGERPAVHIAIAFMVLAIIFFISVLFTPHLTATVRYVFTPFLLLGVSGVIMSMITSHRAIRSLNPEQDRNHIYHKASLELKGSAFIGLLAFLFVSIW